MNGNVGDKIFMGTVAKWPGLYQTCSIDCSWAFEIALFEPG